MGCVNHIFAHLMKITTNLRSRLVSHFWLHGYHEILLPHIYDADLFLTRAGEDVIQKLYTFDRRNRLHALRPEFTTAALAKFIQESHQGEQRWCFVGTNFSDNNGIATEFDEVGAELYNVQGEDGDAEILALAYQTAALIYGGECEVVVNHVGLLRTLLTEAGLDARTTRVILANPKQADLQHLLHTHDVAEPGTTPASAAAFTFLERMHSRSTLGGRNAESIVQRFSQKAQRAVPSGLYRRIADLLDRWCGLQPVTVQDPDLRALVKQSVKATELLERWIAGVSKAVERGVPASAIKVDITLSQRWEYYSGLAFKVMSDNQPVASGGRYDELAGLISPGVSIPAIGFVCQMRDLPAKPVTAPVIVLNTHKSSIELAYKLRSAGISTILSSTAPVTGQAVAVHEGTWQFQGVSGETTNIEPLLNLLRRLS